MSLAPQLNFKWLNGFLHVLRKYIYDLFNVFGRKRLNLLYTDFKNFVSGGFDIHFRADVNKTVKKS